GRPSSRPTRSRRAPRRGPATRRASAVARPRGRAPARAPAAEPTPCGARTGIRQGLLRPATRDEASRGRCYSVPTSRHACRRLVPERRARRRGRLRPREGANGTVNEYDILLMLDPDVPEERHDEIIARTRELIERGGS